MHQQFAMPEGATRASELRRGAADPMQPSGRLPWRMILLASLGGALEFYDFVVFGVFATAIAAAFFPTANPVVSQMLAYAGFAIGYFARPVGGIVLGHFGDRVGRRIVFTGSMLVVSVVTLAMALLPTYAQCGVAAPLLLLALRLVQGFCLGGEIPGAITYAVETVPQRASLVCGVVFACLNAGVLLATLVNLGAQELLPPAALPGWGWRIGFLVGGLLGLLGFRLRRALEETPAFAQMQRRVARLPLREVIAAHPWPVLVGIAVTAATAGYTGLLFAHMPGYLVRVLHYNPRHVAVALNIGIAAASFGLLAVGWLGDHVPRRAPAGRLLAVVCDGRRAQCAPDRAAGAGGGGCIVRKRGVRCCGGRPVSHPCALQRRRVDLQCQLHRLQRNRAAAGNYCHLRYGLRSGAGAGDGRLRGAYAIRQLMDRAARRTG
jgi:MFS family permease